MRGDTFRNLCPYKIADLLRFKTFAINIKSNLYINDGNFFVGFHGRVSGQRSEKS